MPSAADVALLSELLGRVPRGDFEVVTRNADGGPAVIRNAPLLDDGTPMPTRYWLVDRDLVRRVSRIEADRGIPGELGTNLPITPICDGRMRVSVIKNSILSETWCTFDRFAQRFRPPFTSSEPLRLNGPISSEPLQ